MQIVKFCDYIANSPHNKPFHAIHSHTLNILYATSRLNIMYTMLHKRPP